MDGGAWWAPVYGVEKSQAGLSDVSLLYLDHGPEVGTAHVFPCARLVTNMCPTLCDPVDYSPPVHAFLLCELSCFSRV